MRCCATCFGDALLKKNLFQQGCSGICDCCGRASQSLIDPSLARDYFELLLGVYRPDVQGKPLPEILQRDWNLFPDLSSAQILNLLAEIYDDGNRARGSWVAINEDEEKILIHKWLDFRPELMHGNHFFPQAEFVSILGEFKTSIGEAFVSSDEIANTLYRARIWESDSPYVSEDMSAPSKEKAKNGRANPNGIPYLYLASEVATAIAEVRPNPNDLVAVSEVRLNHNLRLVDLQHPRKRVSPFTYSDVNYIAHIRAHLHLMDQLSLDLSKPVLPRTASLDYLPTQYIGEAIKSFGFDGIVFQSSVAEGFNVALFNPDNATIRNPTMHQVTRIDFQFN